MTKELYEQLLCSVRDDGLLGFSYVLQNSGATTGEITTVLGDIGFAMSQMTDSDDKERLKELIVAELEDHRDYFVDEE